MSTECLDPVNCPSVNFNNLCGVCMEAIEEAAIKSALNMGVPEEFGCGHCGRWFPTIEYFVHSCVQKYIEAEVRNKLVFGDLVRDGD